MIMKPNSVHPLHPHPVSVISEESLSAEDSKSEVEFVPPEAAPAPPEAEAPAAATISVSPSIDLVADLSDEEGAPDARDPGVRTAPEGKDEHELVPDSMEDVNAYIEKVVGPAEIPMNIPGQVTNDDEFLAPRSRADSTTSRGSYKAPPTLDAFSDVDYLLVKQINKDKEDFANVPNNYDIVAREIGRIFIGKEETHPEVRAKVKTSTAISQPFRMSIFDVSTGQEVMRVDRNGVNEAPTMVMQKKTKNIDEQLGVIHFEGGWLRFTPTYVVQDHTGKTVLKITGPPPGRLCNSIKYVTSTFDIFDPDGVQRVAKITKDGDFYVNVKDKAEPITKEENFYIDFEDSTMDIKTKALILGATFMLDYTYYKEPSFFNKLMSFFCVILPCCRISK